MLSRPRSRLVRLRIRLFYLGHACMALLCVAAMSASAKSASQTVEVIARIEPELSLSIEPETGSRIDFGTIYSSSAETRRSEPVQVTVRVGSNLGRSYQVTQQLRDPLMNDDGAALPPGRLLAGLEADAGGSLPMAAVKDDPDVLITSDPSGSPAAWSVAYQLLVPPDQPAGTYRGTVLMSVTAQ